MRIIPITGIVVLLFQCCSPPKPIERQNVDLRDSIPQIIDLEKGLENPGASFMLSSIADSIKFILLEKTNESIYRSVNDVEVDGNNLFFLSGYGQKTSYVFRHDLKGRFLNTIGRIGRGPGEYLNCEYTINYDKNEIWVLDWYGNKRIKWFSYTGEIIEGSPMIEFKRSREITVLAGSRLFVNNWFVGTRKEIKMTDAMLKLYDSTFRKRAVVVNPILAIPENINYTRDLKQHPDESSGVYRNGHEAYLYFRWSDTIYYTDNYEIKPLYVLDKGKYAASLLDQFKDYYKDDKPYLGEYLGVNLFINSDFVYLEQHLQELKIVFEYNRKTGEIRSSQVKASGRHEYGYLEYIESPWFIDDLSGSGTGIAIRERTEQNGSVVALSYDALTFREDFGLLKVPEGVRYNQNMLDARLNFIDNLNEDDNPIIVLIYLKDETLFEF